MLHKLVPRKTKASPRRDNIRRGEIRALEQKRLGARFRQSVSEAISKVQPCLVPALPEPVECLARRRRLHGIDGLDHHLHVGKKSVQALHPFVATSPRNDVRFQEVYR